MEAIIVMIIIATMKIGNKSKSGHVEKKQNKLYATKKPVTVKMIILTVRLLITERAIMIIVIKIITIIIILIIIVIIVIIKI